MLLKNLELGGTRMLVNGSRGVITSMMSKKARLPAALIRQPVADGRAILSVSRIVVARESETCNANYALLLCCSSVCP